MVLNFSLYFVLFSQETASADDIIKSDDREQLKFLTLLMIPSILMALDYSLLYLQFEDMQKRSRIQGGVAYMKRFESKRLEKWINTAVFVYTGLFIAIQIVLMVLSVLDVLDSQVFLMEFNALTLVLAIILNVNMTVFYCRNAGSPYTDPKARKKVHVYAWTVGIWTVAFIGRFIFNLTQPSLLNYDQSEIVTEDDEFIFSIETFANILITELIPFYFVIDRRFVKMFTLKHLNINV